MSENGPANLYFDVRQSVKRRNITRLIVAPLFSIGVIKIGLWLVPDTTLFEPRIDVIQTWSNWAFIGVICIASGIYGLIKECVFALRAYGTVGEWHFRLSDHALLWHVPRHAHGKEMGFEVPLDAIKQLELRTIQKQEDVDERQYWIHFHAQKPIQLKPYSGFDLSWLVEKINDAGVPYVETPNVDTIVPD